jgi:hypothetical protein
MAAAARQQQQSLMEQYNTLDGIDPQYRNVVQDMSESGQVRM